MNPLRVYQGLKNQHKLLSNLRAMVEQCDFVPKQNSGVKVKLKSFFYRLIAAIEVVLHYVLNLEGAPNAKPPPRTLGEAAGRVIWLFVNYLKETRVCRVIIHIASAVKIGECSHPVTKESIQMEILHILQSRKKATLLCVEYLKSLVCGVIVRFVKKMKTAYYQNKEPECPQSIDPANFYAHEIMDQMLNRHQESEETIGNKIVAGVAAEMVKNTAELILGNPNVTFNKIKTMANQQLSQGLTQDSSSVHNSAQKFTSGNASLEISTSVEVSNLSSSASQKTVTSPTKVIE